MNLKNRFTQREVKVIGWLLVFIVLIIFTLCLMCSCAYKGSTSINFSLINSRSPSINARGTNTIHAATGFEGGGHLEADIPLAP